MVAIVLSLVLHVIAGLYLYAHRFALTAPPAPPDRPAITIETIRLRPPPPPPSPHEKPRPLRQPAREPIHIHQAPAILGLDPGETIEVPSGPPGGGGEGLGQIAPAPLPSPPPAPPPRPKVILNPDWIRKPSAEQLADAYPPRALRLGAAGSATLLCTVGVSGDVRDCTVIAETPEDFGFGAAALKLSRWFKVRPETQDGQAVDGALVKAPLQFNLSR
jgi:protein TonB